MTKYQYQEEEEARDRVIQAADALVAVWERDGHATASEIVRGLTTAPELMHAVRALRSLHADRGLRDPGTPGEQEAVPEPVHGEDPSG